MSLNRELIEPFHITSRYQTFLNNFCRTLRWCVGASFVCSVKLNKTKHKHFETYIYYCNVMCYHTKMLFLIYKSSFTKFVQYNFTIWELICSLFIVCSCFWWLYFYFMFMLCEICLSLIDLRRMELGVKSSTEKNKKIRNQFCSDQMTVSTNIVSEIFFSRWTRCY